MKKLLMTASIFALTACATSGRKVDSSQLQTFTVGQTTIADAEAKLGQPTQQMSTSDGFTTLIYGYTHAEAKPENFIPFAGAFVGGVNSENQAVTLIFGADGKLKSYSQSSGQNGTGTGLVNGQSQ